MINLLLCSTYKLGTLGILQHTTTGDCKGSRTVIWEVPSVLLPSLAAWKFLHSLLTSLFCEWITSSPEVQRESTGLHKPIYSSLWTSGGSLGPVPLSLPSPLQQQCCRAGSAILHCTRGLLCLAYKGRTNWHMITWKAHSRTGNCKMQFFSHVYTEKCLTAVRGILLLYSSWISEVFF